MAGHGFGGGNEQAVLGVGAEGVLDGARLADVAHGGGGGVGVDVADLAGVEFGVLEGHGHAAGGTFALRMGGG